LDTGFARLARKPRVMWNRLPKGLRDLPAAILVAMLLLSLVAFKPIFCLWACPLKLGTGFLDPDQLTRQLQLASFATIGILTILALPWLTKKRAFCGLVCPFGAWQAFFGRINPYRVTIAPDRCTQCQLCVKACPTFAIEREGLNAHRVLAYCNRCGECMDVCPTGAIDYTLIGSPRASPQGLGRITFLLSAWLVGGSVSMLVVPEVLLKFWRWAWVWFPR
jgi:ferredoxin